MGSLTVVFLRYIKQVDSMLPCVCSVIDHKRRQSVVRTSVTHSAITSCVTFLFLPHFNVVYELFERLSMTLTANGKDNF